LRIEYVFPVEDLHTQEGIDISEGSKGSLLSFKKDPYHTLAEGILNVAVSQRRESKV
jgi:hypothetical protein